MATMGIVGGSVSMLLRWALMELSTTSHFTTGCVDSAESRLVIGQNETALTKTSENSKSSSFPDNSLQFT